MCCQLETWAYNAQCNGEAPSAVKKKKSVTTQARSHTPSASMHRDTGHSNCGSKNGDNTGDSHRQNNQNDSANEPDRVVSVGTYVYAAYHAILYAWAANDMSLGVSMTNMASVCDLNVTEGCDTTWKPTIKALFLGNSRLTVIMSQTSWIDCSVTGCPRLCASPSPVACCPSHVALARGPRCCPCCHML